jgi:uncharacterized membrane protein YkoI
MHNLVRSAGLAALIAASAALAPLGAQQTQPAQSAQQTSAYKRDLPAKLVSQATVAESTAAVTAVGHVPGGVIQAVELENEGGKLIYSYELKVAGRRGIVEVNVDAKTGAVVNTENEAE